jgi:hypothetical protein
MLAAYGRYKLPDESIELLIGIPWLIIAIELVLFLHRWQIGFQDDLSALPNSGKRKDLRSRVPRNPRMD